ncbi:MAG: response regulator transcription factor [Gemmataceae bacterium]
MRVLIAEDEPVSRVLLESILGQWGYEVVATGDGREAWDVLQTPDSPRLAILDWQMPGLDGLELCRRARVTPETESLYLLLLTAKGGTDNLVAGLRAGANDYVTKPFDLDELSARLSVGRRVVELQRTLAERVAELERSLAQVKRLQGLIPICAWCKKVRNDANYWQQVEDYFGENSDARFSHGICPDCFERTAQELSAVDS